MRPVDEAELALMVRQAAGPLRIMGGGSRGVSGPGEALEVGGLSGLVLYEPGALTLVARAGTPVTKVAGVLAAERQRLAFEPPDYRRLLGTSGEPTLGGMVAANASGPRRVQAGACRDALIGVRFVDGRGVVVKNGGRVMKNVTGLDLARLMAGAWGTLGVLSEVAFKLLPEPEAGATLVLRLGMAEAVAAMAAAMGSPFDVTGAAFVGGEILLRLEGFSGSVSYRARALAAVLAGFGPVEVEEGVARWPGVRDVAVFAGKPGDVWRISVKPSDAPAIVERIGAEAVMLDWAGGLIWALVEPGADVRRRIGAFGGHATRVRGGLSFQPEPAGLAAIAAGLRAQFDPRGIFNPGVMV